MVIIQVPYTLSYKEEARIYRKLTSSTKRFAKCTSTRTRCTWRRCFSVLTRLQEGEERDADNIKKARVYAGEDVEACRNRDREIARRSRTKGSRACRRAS